MADNWSNTEVYVKKFNEIQDFCTLQCLEIQSTYGGEKSITFYPLTLERRPIVGFF